MSTATFTHRLLAPLRGVSHGKLGPKAIWVLRILSVLTILLLWEWYGRRTNPILFTHPVAVVEAGIRMARDGTLMTAVLESLQVLSIGFVLGVGVGIAVGVIAGRSRIVSALLDIPTTALYATPMVALVPVLVLWFGYGLVAKIVIVFLFSVFVVLINTARGVREVDSELVEVARSFCSSEGRLWRDVVLPSAMPYMVTGIRLAIGRALVGIVIAEFYTSISGLGFVIVTAANRFRTDEMFVPILILMILGVVLTKGLELLERRISPWRAGE